VEAVVQAGERGPLLALLPPVGTGRCCLPRHWMAYNSRN
jgi:hypothetical protein